MLKIATFQSDVTPPIGSPLCLGDVNPAKKIVAPLSARGFVITGAEAPIVICVVDWVTIEGGGHDFWRKMLAEAAGTDIERVTVHTVHPHDTPSHSFSSAEIADLKDIAATIQDTFFAENAAKKTADALRLSLSKVKPVTHYGYGKAKVSKVASNRRLLGPDGCVANMRWSACPEKSLRDLPEGLIDPWLQNLSFWNGADPFLSLTYYATHPQSFYGDGAVNPDTVGLARSIREATLPDVEHLHFNGCGGNLAPGKYNDRSPKNRLILAERLLKGMETAWARTKKHPLAETDIHWRVKPMELPVNESFRNQTENDLLKIINSNDIPDNRRNAAGDLIRRRRRQGSPLIHASASCLRLGKASILHLPGEMFVEYQLAAKNMRPTHPVLVAAYGNDETGYVGTKKSYAEGGYETDRASHVAPEAEDIIMNAIRELLAE